MAPVSAIGQREGVLRAAPRRWLVTGSAGFIGSHLLETLLRHAGHDPAGLGDGTTGEHTHSAVAAYVASGMADAGFGVSFRLMPRQ